ncbi:MAG: hypothetical protein ACLUFF_07295, partial [Acutalibacteraceae bacterium]
MAKDKKEKRRNQNRAERKHGFLKAVHTWFDDRTDYAGDKPQAIFVPRTQPPAFALSVAATTFKLLLITMLVIGFIGMGAVFGVARAFISTAPDLDVTEISAISLSSYIYDANGELISMYSGSQNRMWAS